MVVLRVRKHAASTLEDALDLRAGDVDLDRLG